MPIIYVEKAIGKVIFELILPFVNDNPAINPAKLHLVKTNLSTYSKGIQRHLAMEEIPNSNANLTPVFIIVDGNAENCISQQLKSSQKWPAFDFHPTIVLPDYFEEIFLLGLGDSQSCIYPNVSKTQCASIETKLKGRLREVLYSKGFSTYGDKEDPYSALAHTVQPSTFLAKLCPTIKPICHSLHTKCSSCQFKIAV